MRQWDYDLGEEIQRDLAQLRRLSRQPKSGPLLLFMLFSLFLFRSLFFFLLFCALFGKPVRILKALVNRGKK